MVGTVAEGSRPPLDRVRVAVRVTGPVRVSLFIDKWRLHDGTAPCRLRELSGTSWNSLYGLGLGLELGTVLSDDLGIEIGLTVGLGLG